LEDKKMKKTLALILALLMCFCFVAACAGNNESPVSAPPPPPPVVLPEEPSPVVPPNNTDSAQSTDSSDESIDPPNQTIDVSVGSTDTSSENTDTPSTSNSEWKEFLRLYEEWADEYVVLIKKYNENPTDMSLLTDYMDSMQKIIEWSEQADKIVSDLSGDDLKEYLATMTRIIEKMSALE